MFDLSHFDAGRLQFRFDNGPPLTLNCVADTPTLILPARSNRVAFIFYSQAGAIGSFGFNTPKVTGSFNLLTFKFPQLNIPTVFHIDQWGPLIQQQVYYNNNVTGNVNFQEWWDNGLVVSNAITPPIAGVRMLKELGKLQEGCYKGIQATEVNKMAAMINRIRKSTVFNPIKRH